MMLSEKVAEIDIERTLYYAVSWGANERYRKPFWLVYRDITRIMGERHRVWSGKPLWMQ